MRIRSEIYKTIKKALKLMPSLNFIDVQKGQMNRSTENYPLPLPAALVEFKPCTWSNTGDAQIGDLLISVYLYVDLVTDSFDSSESEHETDELLDLQDLIFETLQGLDSEYFCSLNRVSDQIVEYRNRFVCYRVDFKTEIQQEKTPIASSPRPVSGFNTNIT